MGRLGRGFRSRRWVISTRWWCSASVGARCASSVYNAGFFRTPSASWPAPRQSGPRRPPREAGVPRDPASTLVLSPPPRFSFLRAPRTSATWTRICFSRLQQVCHFTSLPGAPCRAFDSEPGLAGRVGRGPLTQHLVFAASSLSLPLPSPHAQSRAGLGEHPHGSPRPDPRRDRCGSPLSVRSRSSPAA